VGALAAVLTECHVEVERTVTDEDKSEKKEGAA
jgi:hypothetical protein